MTLAQGGYPQLEAASAQFAVITALAVEGSSPQAPPRPPLQDL